MRLLISILLLLLVSFSVHAQALKGFVTDAETGKPLFPVTIVNNVTQQSASSDEQGFYSIPASSGDLISVTFLGYKTIQLTATPEIDRLIKLSPLSMKLQEYVFHDYTPFQKDSIELSQLYSTELNKKPIKTSFNPANGGGISGLIGGPVQKMSKSYKQNKRFKETFKKDIEQKYIDTRYTPHLVNELTSFTGDTLATFMNLYPMDYSFARNATDLELKMWIRSNYKDHLHKQAVATKQPK